MRANEGRALAGAIAFKNAVNGLMHDRSNDAQCRYKSPLKDGPKLFMLKQRIDLAAFNGRGHKAEECCLHNLRLLWSLLTALSQKKTIFLIRNEPKLGLWRLQCFANVVQLCLGAHEVNIDFLR